MNCLWFNDYYNLFHHTYVILNRWRRKKLVHLLGALCTWAALELRPRAAQQPHKEEDMHKNRPRDSRKGQVYGKHAPIRPHCQKASSSSVWRIILAAGNRNFKLWQRVLLEMSAGSSFKTWLHLFSLPSPVCSKLNGAPVLLPQKWQG